MIGLLLSASIKGTALILLVVIIQWIGRERIPAGWRYAMWLIVLLRLLLPVAPSSPISLFNLAAAEPVAFRVETPPAGTAATQAPRPVLKQAPTHNLPAVAFWIWAAGFLAIMGRYAVSSLTLQRRIARAERRRFPDCPLPLLETDAVTSPALHGIVRPALLVPPGLLDRFDADERRYIFLHELAHLRRGDVLTNCVAALVEAVHWFNPLVWLALARMREERELACDRAALARLSEDERTRYGRTILKLLDCFRTPASAPALVGMASRHDEMKRRIHMIAAFRKSTRLTPLFAALMVVLGFAALTDAQGPEIKVLTESPDPATTAVLEKLRAPVTLEMKEANAIDVAQAIASSAGVTLSLSPDATAEIAAAPKISIKATAIPAHLALLETLQNVKLGMKFTETGVEVTRESNIRRFHLRHAPGEPGELKHEVRVEKHDGAESVEKQETRIVLKKIGGDEEFKLHGEDVLEHLPQIEAGDGKYRLFVSHIGANEGKLEIEVHK